MTWRFQWLDQWVKYTSNMADQYQGSLPELPFIFFTCCLPFLGGGVDDFFGGWVYYVRNPFSPGTGCVQMLVSFLSMWLRWDFSVRRKNCENILLLAVQDYKSTIKASGNLFHVISWTKFEPKKEQRKPKMTFIEESCSSLTWERWNGNSDAIIQHRKSSHKWKINNKWKRLKPTHPQVDSQRVTPRPGASMKVQPLNVGRVCRVSSLLRDKLETF